MVCGVPAARPLGQSCAADTKLPVLAVPRGRSGIRGPSGPDLLEAAFTRA